MGWNFIIGPNISPCLEIGKVKGPGTGTALEARIRISIMNNVLNMTCGVVCCVPATTEQPQGIHYASVGYL